MLNLSMVDYVNFNQKLRLRGEESYLGNQPDEPLQTLGLLRKTFVTEFHKIKIRRISDGGVCREKSPNMLSCHSG
jgi:hypothetical protein